MATDPLLIYMNDHLAGSRSAMQLLDDVITSITDARTREVLDAVRTEIVEDRDVLEDLIRRVGGAPSVLRDVGGWITEKLTWLKLAIDDPSNGPLRRLEALEILALGIQGKGGLWRVLSMVAPNVPALADVNLDNLIRRAAEQYARVEAQRIEAARAVLMHQRNVSATSQSVAKD